MDTRAEWDSLAGIYFPAMVAVTVLVIAAFLYPVVRYRRRREPPSQHSEAPRLELVVGVVLLSVAAVLAALSLSSEGRFAEPGAVTTAAARPVAATRDTLRIDVTGARWRWRFDYPDEGVTTIGGEPQGVVQLVVPRGRPIRFRITSIDVVHSLFLVDARFKRDAVPGYVNEAYLRFDRAGRSFGHCAEFCGTYHPDMSIELVVLEPDAFERWTARGGGRV
jgi:cytochrome c oxidase subunit II